MLVDIEYVKALPEFAKVPDVILTKKIKAVEVAIRSYTNNNFQIRSERIEASVSGKSILGRLNHVKVGDSVQISESVNNGVYAIVELSSDVMIIDEELYEVDHNLVTKIVYPDDVKEGAINMLVYDQTVRKKTGVKSETLSRHRVDYFDMDGENSRIGYPNALIGFLKPYVKARF